MKPTMSSPPLLSLVLWSVITYTAAQTDLKVCSFGSQEPGTICDLIQDSTDDFSWSLRSATTPSQGTGPESGYGGSGYYVFIESSDPQAAGTSARIYTPTLGYVGPTCVRFAYSMFGDHIDLLAMYTQIGDSTAAGNRIIRWQLQGTQGTQWILAAVDVTLTSSQERVGFEANRGNDYQGDIAIDEIIIRTGRCDGSSGGATTTTTTTTTTVAPGTSLASLPLVCDFESVEVCGFSQRSDDTPNYDWTWTNQRTPTSNTGPDTAQSSVGYMFLESSDPRVNGEYAILATPAINYNGPACLSFYYYMYGDGVNTLRVYKNGQRSSPPFQRTGTIGQTWLLANIDFSLNAGDRISFDATRGTNIRGDIAMDTVRLTGTSCQGSQTPSPTTTTTTTAPAPVSGQTDLPFRCTFEVDICSMFQRTNDNFDWTRQSGPTDSSGTGPSVAASGSWYLYTEASSPRVFGEEAYIETPSIRYTGTICTEFSYHMNGGNMGELLVFSSNRGTAAPFYTRMGSFGSEWLTARAQTTISYGERVVFLGIVGRGVQSDISIDDLYIRTGTCEGTPAPTPAPTPSPTPAPTPGGDVDPSYPYYACNMESQGNPNDACRIRQDTGDSHAFLWGSQKTPSGEFNRKIQSITYPVTGPTRAQQGTYYIYTESSQANPSSIARLLFEGSDFRRGGDNCLRFYYNMNGFHTGTLSVMTRMDNGQSIRMWYMKGDKGPNWFNAAVDLNMNGVSQVMIEATMTGQFSGDIALDEMVMTSSRCENIPSGYLWQCNFESGNNAASLCGMQQDTTDSSDFDWELKTGRTKSNFTGPNNAFNGQYYIFIEASKPRNPSDRARIFIPRLNRSGSMCVEFYYHMYGFHTGQLTLVLRRIGTSENRQQWALEGEQGNSWRQARVTVNSVNFDDTIGFVGVRGNEYSGDIALDNVRVRTGAC